MPEYESATEPASTAPVSYLGQPRRRRFQFSLRTIFLVVTCIGILLGTLVVQVILPAELQRAKVEKIKSQGGKVSYADPPAESTWPRRLLIDYLPRDYFDRVTGVDLNQSDCCDDDLADVVSLSQLQRMSLRYTQVTDAGVEKLRQALPNCRIKR